MYSVLTFPITCSFLAIDVALHLELGSVKNDLLDDYLHKKYSQSLLVILRWNQMIEKSFATFATTLF